MNEQHKSMNTKIDQGLVIFLLLAFLTFIEFMIAITSQSLLLLSIVAMIKAGMVIYYYMHIYKLGDLNDDLPHSSREWKTATNRFGFWLFILSDAFLFAGLLTARFNLLGFTRPDLEQSLGLIVTGVLLVSSFFMNRAETQMKSGNLKGFLYNAIITTLLGIGFLIGVVGVEWQHAPFKVDDSAMSAVFFMMTGMHAFHVLTGVLFLIIVINNARKGIYSPENYWPVEAATVYWHFVDVVWIFYYPAIYLIGKLV